ncbi:uncharacterized protein N7511_001140 [Penicillium nucicola]|uniref:uncharacterized protein n=1 Tax=Penicillium nucicola TaxID=1850975 RepID=UPI002545BCAE|nr:uncharacterized protein N7511_001140 [Penicillium nucicola]KAJ5776129.1 hypothetical protein N7511_001140 [Penicillium nucicola]
MRFAWITAALVAGCLGAPTTNPFNPNGDVAPTTIDRKTAIANELPEQCMTRSRHVTLIYTDKPGHCAVQTNNVSFVRIPVEDLSCRKLKMRSGPPSDGNVDPVNEGDVTNNISFLRLC